MTPHYADDWLTVYEGDAATVLRGLDASSVHCVVTSPPYWGLRDYGTASWVGGDDTHEHRGMTELSGKPGSDKQASKRGSTLVYSGDCACGATRIDSQLGLEATPEEYVANLVAVMREVKRVLRDDGTLWLNLGDSYNGVGRGEKANGLQVAARVTTQTTVRGLKHKDLVGIPWRVAFALQADGWYLRSDIIWAKPNPMPESVTDRPTKAHEYLFLLSKSPRYYFDQEAVREAQVEATADRYAAGFKDRYADVADAKGYRGPAGGQDGYKLNLAGRNLRSVWTIATRPYPGAHFAVFPPELPERCIKAGSPEGGMILDPFAGSGTVGLVANRLSRRAVLIDLNPSYLEQQMLRNAQVPVGL